MHNCVLCHNDIPNDLFWQAKPVPGGLACGHCIEELIKLLPLPKTVRDVPASRKDPGPYCYRVEYNGFVTMIDSRDASNEESAKERAACDTSQAWYGILGTNAIPRDEMTVTTLTHNQYVDWIRGVY